ncbi:polysulfide reductase NrfD [Candidatus Chloroploca sp. M-50]|uniref:Polysulfide reductase NrfD n=1 Tax=Candidatus Chloroploca mongolica TaxID=2528176 RepID=A0ABS4D5G7_9CHLR|nr:NrfD/PsrC family molybdoenzyme membrane anchor subunit [Candidatus Chloroploca mongolica]MBP1464677.1 polysulfide reductase NrfD [Candidatus Chloroploca mongolica]
MAQAQPLRNTPPPDPGESYLLPGETYTSMTQKIGDVPLVSPLKTPKGWLIGFSISFVLLMIFLMSVTWLLFRGVGVWGINVPVAWGMDIINFVWWIGIGHAGTLISAILLLLNQGWRNSINRFAEAMTLFAVACAGMYPILHLGRPWLFYWLIPYPNTHGMWPNFRSPLDWDVFAISTYASVSLVFWLVGLLPDFATLRDRSTNIWAKRTYGLAALGWRGSARHWHRYEMASLLLAGLSTPLVVSVHSIISLDFAISQVPGWQVTVFPPYFVAGAVFAGFAMVLLLMIPVRQIYGFQSYITMRHLDVMAKVMLTTGMIVVYGYFMEVWAALYGGSVFEEYLLFNRLNGPSAWAYFGLLFCNAVAIQPLWFKRVRQSIPALLVISVIISIGMWLERYVIIVISLERDFLPSSWGQYVPTFWDWSLYLGTFGLFFTLLFLFIRVMPMINIFEMRLFQYQEEERLHRTSHSSHTGGESNPASAD